MTSSPTTDGARIRYLLDLLSQIPDQRKKRGRRHPLHGLLAVGIAAVIAGSKSFAAIGQWAADAGPEALAALGAERGPAEESTCRRAFTRVSADILDQVVGTWLHTRAREAGGRLVNAVDGKTVRGAVDKNGKAPHLAAALAHGIGAALGQVAVDLKTNEIPAVRDLLKTFADLAGAGRQPAGRWTPPLRPGPRPARPGPPARHRLAHWPIAANDLDPAITAAIPVASSPASACRRPRFLRWSGTCARRSSRYRLQAAAVMEEDGIGGGSPRGRRRLA